MAFFTGTNDHQVRLRFTQTADTIIKYDMNLFKESSRITFINRIVENFYQDANASVGIRLTEYRDELQQITTSSSTSKKVQDSIELLCTHQKEKLLHIIDNYKEDIKGETYPPHRIRNEFFEYLTEDFSLCQEDQFYPSIAQYIKAIIEEYVRLPYLRREQIYFKATIDLIEKAITSRKQLQITATPELVFQVLPYALMTDAFSTHNYLAGFSYKKDEGRSEMLPCSFLISGIQKIQLIKSQNAILHSNDNELMKQALAQRGVQFLLSPEEPVIIRLTEEGKRIYDRQIQNRPFARDITDNVYTFSCSLYQAEYYFFKFGAEAEILSPPSLVERFKEKYKAAYQLYDH